MEYVHYLFWIVFVIGIVGMQADTHAEDCFLSCECKTISMTCYAGFVPPVLPHDIIELTLYALDIQNVSFPNATGYDQLTKLELFASSGDKIYGNYFQSTRKLTYLGVHGSTLRILSGDVFTGLDDVLTLNLSFNPSLEMSYINEAINSENRNVLRKMESFIIADVATTYVWPVDLDKYFFQCLTTGRNIKYVDISGLNIKVLDYNVFSSYACKSVETIIARRAVIPNAQGFLFTPPCQSLRNLDISETEIPVARSQLSFRALNFFCIGLRFYYNIENLYLDNIVQLSVLKIDNYDLQMQTCPLKLQRISASKNNIEFVNFTVHLHHVTVESLRELNLSYNGMKFISPAVLRPSVNLQVIDISHNQLGAMLTVYPEDFEQLFAAQLFLETLNMSYNSLTRIPQHMFIINTKMVCLDISFNLITVLDFQVRQLIHLREINAANNRIKTIDVYFRLSLDFLFKNGNMTRNVRFHNNPFQCECDEYSKTLVDWLLTRRFVVQSHNLQCTLDERKLVVEKNILDEVNKHCFLKTVKTAATYGVPILSVIVVVAVILSVYIVKKRRRETAYKSVVSQIENNSFPLKYVAFLSFSSEDSELAMHKIYPKLSSHLSQMTTSQQDLVCVGDKHFRPGFSLRYELMRCVSDSSVFIAAVSNRFCQKHWCKEEFREAVDQNKPIILIMLEHVERKQMDPLLKKAMDRTAHASWISDQTCGYLNPDWNIFCRSVLQLAGESLPKCQKNQCQQSLQLQAKF